MLQVAKEAEAAYLEAGRKGLQNLGRVIIVNSEAVLPYVEQWIKKEWKECSVRAQMVLPVR